MDPKTPIEVAVGMLAKLLQKGRIAPGQTHEPELLGRARTNRAKRRRGASGALTYALVAWPAGNACSGGSSRALARVEGRGDAEAP